MDKFNNIKYPDYDRSLLSLISSIISYYGVDTPYKTLPELDSLLAENYKNVVFMLFDGMGTAILEKHLPLDAFFRRNMRGCINSVFPPTTTAAITTIESGLPPIGHGWLGWSLYFEEINANVNIFPNTLSGSDGVPAADYNVAQRYIPYKNVCDKIKETTKEKVQAYRVSLFSDFHSQSSSHICDTVKMLCAGEGCKYIYTYWHQPDYDMHDYGTTHEKITENIIQFNSEVEEMCKSLSDTLVIVTADHGLIDTDWRLLSDYPDITACFTRMPSIESRAMTFFIKPEIKNRFEAVFTEKFGDCYMLLSKERVLSENWFGKDVPHPRSSGFIGDYLAVATGRTSIEASSPAQHDLFKAAHAGITEDEVNIPFIVISKR